MRKTLPIRMTLKQPDEHNSYAFRLPIPSMILISSTE